MMERGLWPAVVDVLKHGADTASAEASAVLEVLAQREAHARRIAGPAACSNKRRTWALPLVQHMHAILTFLPPPHHCSDGTLLREPHTFLPAHASAPTPQPRGAGSLFAHALAPEHQRGQCHADASQPEARGSQL